MDGIASILVFSYCTLVLGWYYGMVGIESYECKHLGLLILLMEDVSRMKHSGVLTYVESLLNGA